MGTTTAAEGSISQLILGGRLVSGTNFVKRKANARALGHGTFRVAAYRRGNTSREVNVIVQDKVKNALAMPWAMRNELRRVGSVPWIRLGLLVHGVRWGQRWRIFGMPRLQLHRGSTLELGNGLELRSWPSSNPLTPYHPVVFATRTSEAIIRVGNDCGFTGATVVAAEKIEIGDRVLVGANAIIVDTDFHPIEFMQRRKRVNAGATAPVYIEDDVFIGMNAIILKGVRLGAGCVVGAGSVVTQRVAPGAVVAGNPAKVIRLGTP